MLTMIFLRHRKHRTHKQSRKNHKIKYCIEECFGEIVINRRQVLEGD